MRLDVLLKIVLVAAIFPTVFACNTDTCDDSEISPGISVDFRVDVFVNDSSGAPSNTASVQINVHKEPCGEDGKGYFGWNPSTAFGQAQSGPFGYNLNNRDDVIVATVTVNDAGNSSTKTKRLYGNNLISSHGQLKVISFNFP